MGPATIQSGTVPYLNNSATPAAGAPSTQVSNDPSTGAAPSTSSTPATLDSFDAGFNPNQFTTLTGSGGAPPPALAASGSSQSSTSTAGTTGNGTTGTPGTAGTSGTAGASDPASPTDQQIQAYVHSHAALDKTTKNPDPVELYYLQNYLLQWNQKDGTGKDKASADLISQLNSEIKSKTFGKATEQFVKMFQDQKQLLVDGIVGDQTWSAVAGATHPLPPAEKVVSAKPDTSAHWYKSAQAAESSGKAAPDFLAEMMLDLELQNLGNTGSSSASSGTGSQSMSTTAAQTGTLTSQPATQAGSTATTTSAMLNPTTAALLALQNGGIAV